jgi:hypothetical protein
VLMILTAPLLLLTILLGVVVGAVPGVVVAGFSSLFVEGATPWIMGVIVAIPIFILIIISPMLFLGGLVQVYLSNLWTLTYRDVRGKEAPVRAPLPAAPPAAARGMAEGVAD